MLIKFYIWILRLDDPIERLHKQTWQYLEIVNLNPGIQTIVYR